MATLAALTFVAMALSRSASWAVANDCQSAPQLPDAASEYVVSLRDAAQHLAHVRILLRDGDGTRTLNLPVWNALYQVRNFAASVMNVRAQDASGATVAVANTEPSEWQFRAPAGCIMVTYDIHLDAPGPFGSQLTAEHGFLNWAMALMYAPELRSKSTAVRLEQAPQGWQIRDLQLCHTSGNASPVTEVRGGAGDARAPVTVCAARSYDELADSPVMLGHLQETSFQQDGATYHIVVDGDPADYDMAKLSAVLKSITHAGVDWMQDRPFEQYTFLYHFPRGPGGGGMEHAYGTAIEVSADRLREGLLPVADVSAHEFFHLWNVKRIRPQSLQPVEYQHEQSSQALWFSEGVTSTASDLLLARAGLTGEALSLQRLARLMTELQRRPAHRWQSAEDASVGAWFEGDAFYRSPERSISYYNKGNVLGVMLDLRIRQLTGGRKSLRDLFHWMNEQYAKTHRPFPDSEGVEQAAEAVTGQSFTEFFRDYVAGVAEIPYDEFLRFVGLRLVAASEPVASAGFTTTANLGGQPEVLQVTPGSEAQRSGVAPGDRVLEVNGSPADSYFDIGIALMAPGTTVRLKMENRWGIREIKLHLSAREERGYRVEDLPGVSAQQRAHRAAWLRGDDESGGAP